MLRAIALVTFGFFLGLGVSVFAADAMDVQRFFSSNKVGDSPDFAFVKDGVAGREHLITIHGFASDRSVCQQLAEEYNGGGSNSVLPGEYQCVQLNQ